MCFSFLNIWVPNSRGGLNTKKKWFWWWAIASSGYHENVYCHLHTYTWARAQTHTCICFISSSTFNTRLIFYWNVYIYLIFKGPSAVVRRKSDFWGIFQENAYIFISMKGLVNKDTFKEILLNSHVKVFVYLRIMSWKAFLKR